MKAVDGNQYRKITVEKMRTNPAKFANLPPHVLQHIGYRFHDLVVHCVFGETDTLCNESNAILFTHDEMYNCYTLKLIQGEISDAGPNDGLSLLLYIGKKDVEIYPYLYNIFRLNFNCENTLFKIRIFA